MLKFAAQREMLIYIQDYRFPPRKGQVPAASESSSSADTTTSQPLSARLVLHSPLSPLTPNSPTYPDGVMTSEWIAKHQQQVPAVFVAFFNFASDTSRNSLHDNQLKNEINGIKSMLHKIEYNVRFVAVLISDKTVFEAPNVDERLGNIKRATGLDTKASLFFLPPSSSPSQVAQFTKLLLSALQTLCIDFYRDLTKHARRKKNRGSVPPPTLPPTRGTSQTLGSLGWGIRYDFKLGIFAEFRQETESACRHYTSALESLLGTDGIFETTASWSPRWDEARLLADVVAFRIIHCLLWIGSTTMATQSWDNYRERIRALVDSRGKGSSGYGWEAWESTWAQVMAQIIQKSDLSLFSLEDGDADTATTIKLAVFAPPEKSIPHGERILPWHHLHHPGYWARMAARHAVVRRKLAYGLPEEDREPPGRSPVSALSNRATVHDTYLCPAPYAELPLSNSTQIKGFDHSANIVSYLNQSHDQFKRRRQPRMAERLQLDIGKETMRTGDYSAARDILQPLWRDMSWRSERWVDLVFEVNRTLRGFARTAADTATFVATQFELCSAGRCFLSCRKTSTNSDPSCRSAVDTRRTIRLHAMCSIYCWP